ncbi:twin-arginine translocase TatA/TatE family subunit [Candidatus Poribacteria bacterium]|nr:twin-arginine translocase TatA/TatE family subunit [Candidatus Poribacteria bacterium]
MGIGPMEILAILVLALVVFGPKRLPEMGKSIGQAIREFKSVGNEIQEEITKVTEDIDIDPDKTIKPPKSD